MSDQQGSQPVKQSVPKTTKYSFPVLGMAILGIIGVGGLIGQGLGLKSIVSFGAQKEQWEASVAQRDQVRQEWQKLVDESQSTYADYQKKTPVLKAETEALTAERDRLFSELSRLNKDQELLRDAREQLQRDQQMATLSAQQSDARKADAEKRVTELDAAAMKLKEEIRRLTTDHDALAKTVADLWESVQQSLRQHQATTQATGTSERQTSESQTRLRELQAALVKAAADVDAVLGDKATAMAQRDEAAASQRTAQAQVRQLQAEAKRLQDEIDTAKAAAVQHGDAVEAVAKERRAEQTALDDLKQQSAKAIQAMGAASGELASAKSQLLQLTTERDAVAAETAKLTSVLKPLRAELAQFNADLEARKTELSHLQQRAANARAEEERLIVAMRRLAGDRDTSPSSQPAANQ